MTELAPHRAVAAFDSATALLSALARALDGRDFPHLGQGELKARLVRGSAILPLRTRRRVYAIASGREGVPVHRLRDVDLEQVAGWTAAQYSSRRYAGVLLGSSNGALTHLAAACGVPWLPQTMLVPVRRPGADPDDVLDALEFGRRYGRTLLATNPDVDLHHMHDPNQDRLSSSQMAYFRVKWRRLPAAYQRFLAHRLEPGAPVVLIRDRSSWPVTRLGARHVFQLGAEGGMTAEEYLADERAVVPDDTAAEAEWGFGEPLGADVRDWASRHGHPLLELTYDHPQQPAAGVAEAFRSWLVAAGQPGQRLLVSSFIVHDPWRTLVTGSVPFWTFFPVRRAAADLADYLDHASYDEIDIMLFSHGVVSRGLADAPEWQRLADRARRHGRLLAVDPKQFPADFAVFARYAPALRSLPEVPAPGQPLDLLATLPHLGTVT